MTEQIRFRKEDLLRAEYGKMKLFSELELVVRKGESVRTYKEKKDWLGRKKEVHIISDTETYAEDMYIDKYYTNKKTKYEVLSSKRWWIDNGYIVIDDNVYKKPYVMLYFREKCGAPIYIEFNNEQEAQHYLDCLSEELPMLVVVKE